MVWSVYKFPNEPSPVREPEPAAYVLPHLRPYQRRDFRCGGCKMEDMQYARVRIHQMSSSQCREKPIVKWNEQIYQWMANDNDMNAKQVLDKFSVDKILDAEDKALAKQKAKKNGGKKAGKGT